MARVVGPGPSLRSQWLGERMRRIRKRLRVPQQEAADHIQRNNSMLGRYESGEIPFRRNDVIDLLDFYGVSNELERKGLLQLCDEVWRKDWWDPHTDDFGQDFIDIPWLESRAERICVYQHIIVHGLLQTREYAEALIRFGSKERTRRFRLRNGSTSESSGSMYFTGKLRHGSRSCLKNPPCSARSAAKRSCRINCGD